jgi:hypothetical protein
MRPQWLSPKSLSQQANLSRGDVGTRQMQKGQRVAHALIPTDQHTPDTNHPTVRALHDPQPRPEPGFLLQCLGLFTPCPDMGREPELDQQVTDLVSIVAFVQPHPLRPVICWLWPLDGQTREGLLGHLEVMAVGPLHARRGRSARRRRW